MVLSKIHSQLEILEKKDEIDQDSTICNQTSTFYLRLSGGDMCNGRDGAPVSFRTYSSISAALRNEYVDHQQG
jgi:hypothetical protein